ncbi:hypothetical protein AAVH_32051 [Aphelenchoides avenae]|nr:hypothetical protein AAVH_32051 [Aphelenchus avenae]
MFDEPVLVGLHSSNFTARESLQVVDSCWYTLVACLKNCSAELHTSSAVKTSASIELPHFRNSVTLKFQSLPSSEKYGDAGLIEQIILHPPVPRRLKQFPPKQSSINNHLQNIAATVKRIFK